MQVDLDDGCCILVGFGGACIRSHACLPSEPFAIVAKSEDMPKAAQHLQMGITAIRRWTACRHAKLCENPVLGEKRQVTKDWKSECNGQLSSGGTPEGLCMLDALTGLYMQVQKEVGKSGCSLTAPSGAQQSGTQSQQISHAPRVCVIAI